MHLANEGVLPVVWDSDDLCDEMSAIPGTKEGKRTYHRAVQSPLGAEILAALLCQAAIRLHSLDDRLPAISS